MNKGERLIYLREKKSKSQTEAARYLGISKQSLYKYEKNIVTNIPSDVVERMATYYNTTPQYIMGWEYEDRAVAVTEPSKGYMPWPPGTGNDLDEESMEFAHLFQDASEEERALVMAYLKKKQPKP